MWISGSTVIKVYFIRSDLSQQNPYCYLNGSICIIIIQNRSGRSVYTNQRKRLYCGEIGIGVG
ncbi:hypothetical protein C0033_22870 [Clostridium sp. chh4-2]|nr:hypothetical protein C0033_22870 [Clostridium sp. chh4-2]